MLAPSLVSLPNTIRLQFEITHSAKLRQAQLLANSIFLTPDVNPLLIDCKSLNGSNPTIEFVTTELTPANPYISLKLIDEQGNFYGEQFSFDMTALVPESEPVSIPDANLAEAIRQKIGNAITTHTADAHRA